MHESRKPTRDDVINAYTTMLGRPPENEAAIAEHLNSSQTVLELIRNFANSQEFSKRIGHKVGAFSPFFHYNASVDVQGIIEAHVNPNRVPLPGHYVNFLGVAMPTNVMPHIGDKGGQLDAIPIPANYHADMAEWAAALRAVDLAEDAFVMIELGCGWGCWMNNTGVAAKTRGLKVHVIGIEGDEQHLQFAREALKANHISPKEYTLLRGIAAARPGYALFPRMQNENRWGSEPVFDVSESDSEKAVATGKYDRLRMILLSEAIDDHLRIDLIHIDIQGGEANLIEQSLTLLSAKVGYLVIGTHSRSIEGRLFDVLLGAGWVLEIERPAIFQITEGKPVTRVDGVQSWRNPKIGKHRRP